MGTQCQQIDPVGLDIHGDLAHGLRRVRHQSDIVLFGNGRNLANGLDRARFIIGIHHRNEDRMFANGVFQIGKVYQPVGTDWQVGHFSAHFFNMPACVEHRFVFGDDGNDMFFFAFVAFENAFNGQVGSFRSAGGEYDLLRVGADEVGHLFPRNVHRFFRFPAIGMSAAGRITEFF